jgi:adhesin transport system membrane fusion protein
MNTPDKPLRLASVTPMTPIPAEVVKPLRARAAQLPAHTTYADPVLNAARDQRAILWLWSALLMVALFGVLGVWAYYARIEQVASGSARVIASQREQVIQSLEGGILKEMFVREGDIVNSGDPLLRIDPMRAQSSFQEGRYKFLALKASSARLRAESQGDASVRFDDDVRAEPGLMNSEKATFTARQASLNQSVTGLRRSRDILLREIDITEPMVARGLAPEVDLLRLRRQASDLDLQISERTHKARADAATDLVRVESELAQQTEVLSARKDQMVRTLVRAPVRGTVKNVRITTTGGVIQPAQDILEIVPLGDTLLVEAKIKPTEVAFLRPGLPANVKISAYDSQIYGSLKGKVEFISPDTLREERKTEDDTYYRVVIRTDKAFVMEHGHELPVLPGMTATVDILTGERTVANYLLKPVLRLKEAFRER